ncbi:MAG TPA: PVC-type heme-binding CxxCH protein, partial [Opitutus sp.]|nr:PVC-type heme-binding CxxCH protein [Opitutus sp.]
MPLIAARTRLAVLFLPVLLAPLFAQRGDYANASILAAAEQQKLFQTQPGFEVQLVASEPQIQKPMNIAFDAQGRVWVTGSQLYPWPARRDAVGAEIADYQKNWDDNNLAFRAMSAPPPPPEQGIDEVRVLSDFGPDGRARKSVTFADKLNIPIGVMPLPREPGARGDTVLVYSIPAIWRLTDTDGDGRADVREKLYDGFGFKDTHGMSSNYWMWYDGWVYGTHGFANTSEVKDRDGRVVTLNSGNTYRFRPDGSRFEIFAHGQTNPFGLAFDARGDVYTADSHSKPVYLILPGGYYEGIGIFNVHDGLGFAPAITDDDHGSSAIAGIAHYSAAHFPSEYRDNIFNGNPVTRRINRVRLDWRGSTPTATRLPDFLTSEDRAFRPIQTKLGPDGALWIVDFYNPIIGHYEAPLTHPARDRMHGRIWRVVWRGLDGSVAAPLLPDLTQASTEDLVRRLADPNLTVRSLAMGELMTRPDADTAVGPLRKMAERIVAGSDSAMDATALLPVEIALRRLGAADDARFGQALARGEGPVAQAAMRALEVQAVGSSEAIETALTKFLREGRADLTARIAAAWFQRNPLPWQAPLILEMLGRTPEADTELRYALRLALKEQLKTANLARLQSWAGADDAAEWIADVALAVRTVPAAEYLLDYLEQTKFESERAGEFARHAVRELPPERLHALRPLIHSLSSAPRDQRLALAEGLAKAGETNDEALPKDVRAWMRQELVGALGDEDDRLAVRAANALKPFSFPEKAQALHLIAADAGSKDFLRIAALRALDAADSQTQTVLAEVVRSTGASSVRRVAATLLGEMRIGSEGIAALQMAFGDAPADLAVAVATAM